MAENIQNRAPKSFGALWEYQTGKKASDDTAEILVCEKRGSSSDNEALSWAFIVDEYSGVKVASENWYYKDRILCGIRLPKWINKSIQNGNAVLIKNVEIKTDGEYNGRPRYYAIVQGREIKPSEYKKVSKTEEKRDTWCDDVYHQAVRRYNLVTKYELFEENNIRITRNHKSEKTNIREYGVTTKEYDEFKKTHPYVCNKIKTYGFKGEDLVYKPKGLVCLKENYDLLTYFERSDTKDITMEDTGSSIVLKYVDETWSYRSKDPDRYLQEVSTVAINSLELIEFGTSKSSSEYESDDGWGTRTSDSYYDNLKFEMILSDGGKVEIWNDQIYELDLLKKFGGEKSDPVLFQKIQKYYEECSEKHCTCSINGNEYLIEKLNYSFAITIKTNSDANNIYICLGFPFKYLEEDRGWRSITIDFCGKKNKNLLKDLKEFFNK